MYKYASSHLKEVKERLKHGNGTDEIKHDLIGEILYKCVGYNQKYIDKLKYP